MFNKDKIKELYPGAEDYMIQPMLIHSSTDSQLKMACASGEYFGQLKKDGALYMFLKVDDKSYLFGRTVSVQTGLLTEKSANVPHIMNALNCLPNGTMLIGEIYYPGGTSKNTTSIMGCLPARAIERQNGSYGLIHYYVHDILAFGTESFLKVNNWKRYNYLKEMWKYNNLNNYDFLELAEAWEDDLYIRIGQALAAGEEGMVIKKKDGLYEPGRRPLTNLKAKKVDTLDAVIIGFEKPTYEYYGKELDTWEYYIDNVPVTKAAYMHWDNSRIHIGCYDGDKLVDIGTIASGISDEMKKDMTENPNDYLNHVCEIQVMEKDNKAHTLRHGFFKNMRPDKSPTECLIQNIFA